jgi:hypothetical protein
MSENTTTLRINCKPKIAKESMLIASKWEFNLASADCWYTARAKSGRDLSAAVTRNLIRLDLKPLNA